MSNLRAVVILIVVAFHSCLAYLASAPPQTAFDKPPYEWRAFPVIDSHRWLGFDIFCATQDVSLMALMFFLSGLLTAQSLERKGARVYLIDRVRRIALPFVLAMLVLSPLALYPAYSLRTADPTLTGFWAQLMSLPFWPCGPQWFLWQLFAINVMAVGFYTAAPDVLSDFRRLAAWASSRPLSYFAVLGVLSVATYAPLALIYSPFEWTALGPFAVQICRPFQYILVFFAGMALGSLGMDRGLLACDGSLARHWLLWMLAAALSFVIWASLTLLTLPDWTAASIAAKLGVSFAYPLASLAGGMFMLAIFLRFSRTRSRVLDSLSANAYGIYFVHYVFVVWLQYALLPSSAPAPVKTLLVFICSLGFSWATSIGFNRLLAVSMPIRTKRPIWIVSR